MAADLDVSDFLEWYNARRYRPVTSGRTSCSQQNVSASPRVEMAGGVISAHDEIQDDPPTLRPKAGKKEYLPPDVVWRRKWGLILCKDCGCHYTTPCPTHGLPAGEVYPFDAYWREG